jgi:pyruvate ferredoxin oxidoreductase alpha subunit/phenylglyoxylate dehydrogenase alpha subunit
MSILSGASMAGARCYTATSSQGLALMYEPYFRASTLRLPIVMNIVNREMISPQSVWGGPQDSLTLRDAGWLQIYVEDNQEILDTTIQAFRIAEDQRVLLPINVCYDGFYLSHMTERVEVPTQAQVDGFLPPYIAKHQILDPARPMAIDPLTSGYLVMEYRKKHMAAQAAALGVLAEVDREYESLTGRSWGGAIASYRMEDAEYAVVTMGSVTGACREMIDEKRSRGIRVGLVKIRCLRPFPREAVMRALSTVKGFGVIDRNVSFGWNHGIVYQEVKAALYGADRIVPSVPFIGGLGGEDITMDLVSTACDTMIEAVDAGKTIHEAVWLWSPRKGVKL